MKSDVSEKSFDCVAFMREQRARLSEEMTAMGSEGFRRWLHNKEYDDPTLARLKAQARPVGRTTQ